MFFGLFQYNILKLCLLLDLLFVTLLLLLHIALLHLRSASRRYIGSVIVLRQRLSTLLVCVCFGAYLFHQSVSKKLLCVRQALGRCQLLSVSDHVCTVLVFDHSTIPTASSADFRKTCTSTAALLPFHSP